MDLEGVIKDLLVILEALEKYLESACSLVGHCFAGHTMNTSETKAGRYLRQRPSSCT